jgi:PAS domain S-box-containing protein
MSVKPKSADEPDTKKLPEQNNLSCLSDDILATIGVGIYLVQNGNFVYIGPLHEELTGYSGAELLGTNSLDHVHPDDREMARENSIKSLKGGSLNAYECRFIKKNGDIMWLLEMVTSSVYGGERATLGSFMDITERKRTEADLRQSEQRYRTILESIQEGYFEVDLAGNFTFVNESECIFRGYTKEELIGKNYRQYADRENSKKVFQAFNKLYGTGEQIKELDYKIIKKDGTKAFTEISASLIRNDEGKPTGFRGITHDVTERKQMEEMIRQSENRYRTFLESTKEGYFEVDLAGDFTFVNDAECSNLGYPREELIGMNYRQYADETTDNKLYRLFKKVYRTGDPVRGFESGYIRKDGTKGFNEISISLIRDSEGKQIGFRGLSRDITERKLMEETIRQSEERYRTIIEEMEEWYFETDLTGNIIFTNDVFANVLGHSQNELPGLNFRSFIKKEESESVYKLFHQVFETGEPIKNFPHEFVRPDSSIIFAELSIFPKRDREGNFLGFRGVGHNITERKRTEQQLNYMVTHDLYKSKD